MYKNIKRKIRKLLHNVAITEHSEELITLRKHLENIEIYMRSQMNVKRLPLFLLLGAQKCGKTSLITTTNLTILKSFPATMDHGLKEPESSHENIIEHDTIYDDPIDHDHCHQFHLTKEAVYLDLSGKYATSEIKKNDTTWQKSLTLLAQHSNALPIAGVICVIDIFQFLNQDKQKRKLHLHLLKQRIFEIKKLRKQPLPFYIILSKADLIAGFKECFDQLSAVEKEKAFGIDFKDYLNEIKHEQSLSTWFYQQFNKLLEKTNQHLVTFLHHEHNLVKRQLIFEYVIQLDNIKDYLKQIVLVLADKTFYCNVSMPLGIYFTSALQQGEPLDRIGKSYDKLLHGGQKNLIKFQPVKHQPFFIKDLFTTQIPESIHYTFEKSDSKPWKISIGFAVITTGFISLLIYVIHQFNMDVNKISNAQLALIHSHLSKQQSNQIALDQDLQIANAFLADASSFWLINGEHTQKEIKKSLAIKTNNESNLKKFSSINNAYLELSTLLEENLVNPNNSPDIVYNTLKAYLMLENPEKFNDDFFISLNKKILIDRGAKPQEIQILTDKLHQFLKQKKTKITINHNLVNSARKTLTTLPKEYLAYIILLSNEYKNLVDTLIIKNDLVSASNNPDITIPKFFTAQGFAEFLTAYQPACEEAVHGNWILGQMNLENNDTDNIPIKLVDLYLNNYAIWWQKPLRTFQALKYNSLSEIATLLTRLSAPSSTLKLMLDQIAINTSASTLLPEKYQTSLKNYAQISNSLHSHLTQFDALNKFTLSQYNQFIEKLMEFSNYIHTLNTNQEATFNSVAMIFNAQTPDDPYYKLYTYIQTVPAPLNQLLNTLAELSFELSLKDTREFINLQWQRNIMPQYNAWINNNYPVFKNVFSDISLKNFTVFFGPEGLINQFFTLYILPFIDASQSQWQWKSKYGLNLHLSDSATQTFMRAKIISSMFFPNGEHNLNIHFSLQQQALMPIVKKIQVHLNGQTMDDEQGSRNINTFVWPGNSDEYNAQLEFIMINGQHLVTTALGPWAWFKLLDKAQIKPMEDPKQFQLNFNIDGTEAKILLLADNPINPFISNVLEGFRCPDSLLG
jgi:type VI secretion system IcmF/VasK family protein